MGNVRCTNNMLLDYIGYCTIYFRCICLFPLLLKYIPSNIISVLFPSLHFWILLCYFLVYHKWTKKNNNYNLERLKVNLVSLVAEK